MGKSSKEIFVNTILVGTVVPTLIVGTAVPTGIVKTALEQLFQHFVPAIIVGTIVPTIIVGTAVSTIIVLTAYYWKSCLWVGQSFAWFYTINLPNYNFPNKNTIQIQRLTKLNTSDLSLVLLDVTVKEKLPCID